MKIQTLLLISISQLGISSSAYAALLLPTEQEFSATLSNTYPSFNAANILSSNTNLTAPLSIAASTPAARHANVCFITDTEDCRGNKFSSSPEDNPVSPPSPPPTNCDPNDAWCIDNEKRCDWEGYLKTLKDCNEVQVPHNYCPYDETFFEKCICDPTLVACPYPLQGVGKECEGKYRSCKCPDYFSSCECGPADGALSCTWDGKTTYSACKPCCSDTCPSGSISTYCNSDQDKIQVSTTECGTPCYSCQDKHSHSYSCPSGYQSSPCSNGYTQIGTANETCSCGEITYTLCYKCQAPAAPSCVSGGSSSCTGSTYCTYGYTSSCKDCSGTTRYQCKSAPSCVSGGSSSCTGSTSCSNGYTSSCKDCNGTTRYQCKSAPSCVSGGSSSCTGSTSCSNGYTSSCKDCNGTTRYQCKSAPSCVSGGSSSCTGSTSCQYGYTSSCKNCSGTTLYKCKSCSNTCSSGSLSVSCKSYETKKSVGTTECGNTCYKCEHSHSYSCPTGYQSSSCGSGYTQTGSTSKKCACGATSGTCYKCEKKTCTPSKTSCPKTKNNGNCVCDKYEAAGDDGCGNTVYRCRLYRPLAGSGANCSPSSCNP